MDGWMDGGSLWPDGQKSRNLHKANGIGAFAL